MNIKEAIETQVSNIYEDIDITQFTINYTATATSENIELLYNNTPKTVTEKKIDTKEKEDRFIAIQCLNSIITADTTIHITTNNYSSIDLYSAIIKGDRIIKFNTEIKCNTIDEEDLNFYGRKVLLKKQKYESMMRESNGRLLYYMVLLNKKECYIFNLNNLDWKKVESATINERKTHVDTDSPVIPTEVYRLPLSLAHKVIPCEQYYKKYQVLTES